MKKLAQMMKQKGWSDTDVAVCVGCSRIQIGRIRRGKSGVSVALAMKLQDATGIAWTYFVKRSAALKKAKAS